MCSPIGDDAAAAILCSSGYLKTLPSEVQNRAVKAKASAFSGGKYRDRLLFQRWKKRVIHTQLLPVIKEVTIKRKKAPFTLMDS